MNELDTRAHWRRWFKRFGLVVGVVWLLLWVITTQASHQAQFETPYYEINLESRYSGWSTTPVPAELQRCRYGQQRQQFACRYTVQWRRWMVRGGCYIRSGHGLRCWVVIPERYWENPPEQTVMR